MTRIYCFLLLVLISFSTKANTNIDSILTVILKEDPELSRLKAFDQIFRRNLYSDRSLASAAVDSIKSISLRSKNQDHEALYINRKGSLFFVEGQYDEALDLYNKSYEFYIKLNNEKEASGILINIANCYGEIGDLEKSLETHLKSLSIQKKLGIKSYPLATNLTNIAVLHSNLKDPVESLKWSRRARKIFEELEDDFAIAEVDYNMAISLYDVDSLQKAQTILDKLEVYHRENENVYKLTDVLFESGKNQYRQGNLELSERYLLNGLQIAKANEDKVVYGIAYNKLFELYMAKNDLAKAERYALLSYEHTKDVGRSLELLIDIENLATLYEELGEYKKSVAYHKEFQVLNDSLVGIETLNTINELKTKYETEKQQQEIALLKEKEKRTSIEKKALTGGIISLIIFFAGLVYLLRQRIAKAKLEKEKSEQELVFNKKELALKNKELVAYTLQLAHKNEFLEDIKSKVVDLERIKDSSKSRRTIVNAININQNDSQGWEGFKERFKAVHGDFDTNAIARFPSLTSNDLRLMALLKMNLSSKEVASTLNISPEGVKKARYRLRKKLSLETEDSLEGLIMEL